MLLLCSEKSCFPRWESKNYIFLLQPEKEDLYMLLLSISKNYRVTRLNYMRIYIKYVAGVQ